MSRRRRILLGVAALVLLAGGFVAFQLRPMFAVRTDVVSIQSAPEYQDAALMRRAFSLPVAAAYQKSLLFQSNPSACGPTSIANVARTLGETGATARGVTDGTGHCPLGICMGGLTLDEVAEVVRKHPGRRAEVFRDLTLAGFRTRLADCNDPSKRCLVNFDRGALFGRGGGHHSPIGGYLAAENLVLVMDVNAHYRPWLVRTERLLAAMNTQDLSTGKSRGMVVIQGN